MSNAEEFGDWLVTVRGDTAVVVDEHRPVPLWQHMMVGRRLFDLFGGATRRTDGELQVDPELVRATRGAGPAGRRPPSGTGPAGPAARRRRGGSASGPPSRVDVIDRLDGDGLLPGDHLHLQPGRLRRRRRPSACAPGCG